jgi:glycosyltransferase 2 family protein
LPKARNGQIRRHWSWIVRIVVAAAAIAWVCRGQNWQELRRVLGRMSLWYFALSLFVYAAAQLIIAYRWWVLLRAQGIRINILAVFRLHYLGLFYNNVMPGSVGGDLLKAWYVTKHTDRRLEGALSVFVDRFIGLFGTFLMAGIAYFFLLRGRAMNMPSQSGIKRSLGGYGQMILWVIAGLAVLLAVAVIHPYGRAELKRGLSYLLRFGVSASLRVREAVVLYCSKPLTLFYALLLTAIGQGVVVTAFWPLGRSLGIDAGLRYYLLIFPAMWVVGAVPISIAGLGVLEGGMVALFMRLAGATQSSATALAICQRFIWVLASLPGGLIHLLGAHLPKEFFVDAENPVN